MKLAIMQPYFFPYIGFFQLINSVDKILLYENFNFKCETWMARNRLLTKNGQPFYIHILVQSKSSFKKISEIKIVTEELWRIKLLKSLHYNYVSSKYYQEVFPQVEKIIK